MMDALRQPALEHLRLQPPLQKVLDLEREHVIEPHARLVEYTNAHEPADERVALEEPLRVLVVELEQLTRGTPDFGEDQGDTPDLALVAEAVLARELGHTHRYRSVGSNGGDTGKGHLELGIETGGFERPTGDLVTRKSWAQGDR